MARGPRYGSRSGRTVSPANPGQDRALASNAEESWLPGEDQRLRRTTTNAEHRQRNSSRRLLWAPSVSPAGSGAGVLRGQGKMHRSGGRSSLALASETGDLLAQLGHSARPQGVRGSVRNAWHPSLCLRRRSARAMRRFFRPAYRTRLAMAWSRMQGPGPRDQGGGTSRPFSRENQALCARSRNSDPVFLLDVDQGLHSRR